MGGVCHCKTSVCVGKASLHCNDIGERTTLGRILDESGAAESSASASASASSLQKAFEDLSVSKCLVRNVSHKLRKKSGKGRGGGGEEEEGSDRKGSSSGCLGLYGRGGGCKVGADICEEFGDGGCKRKSSAGEEIKGYQPICGTEDTSVDCFSYGAERIWKRSSRKDKAIEETAPSNTLDLELFPDELLEMCLSRLPLTALMAARVVCKKWRCVTMTSRFIQMRREYQTPWLFLFGVVKDGYCSGRIHALDVSLDRWNTIDADILKGRFLFSVASLGDDVYVVGGCSSLTSFGRVDKSSFKTHKGILVFNPVSRSWRKVASMKYPRSSPILGVFEVNSNCSIFQSQQERYDRRFTRTRLGGVSDVYEDPHRLSLRRQFTDAFNETEASVNIKRNTREHVKPASTLSDKVVRRFLLIAVGGLGSWDEPLDSGEIYDPISNKWIDIGRLPGDFGVVCSGIVCNGLFYIYSESDKLAAYDLERCVWFGIQTTQSPPRLLEYYPKLISCNSQLYMLSVSWCEHGGQTGRREKAVRKLWELDVKLLTWKEISRHPDAPMDWNAAFVADRGRIFGVEMFKIFGQVLDFFSVCDVSNLSSGWSHISRKHVANELDASSCITKSLAVLHL